MNNKIRLLIAVVILAAAGYLILNRPAEEPAKPDYEIVEEKDLEHLGGPAQDIQKIPTHASENPYIEPSAKPQEPQD